MRPRRQAMKTPSWAQGSATPLATTSAEAASVSSRTTRVEAASPPNRSLSGEALRDVLLRRFLRRPTDQVGVIRILDRRRRFRSKWWRNLFNH